MNEAIPPDQSIFTDTQDGLMAPPEIDMSPAAVAERTVRNRKRWLLVLAVSAGLVAAIWMLGKLRAYLNQPEPYVPPPTVTPVPTALSTKMQDELARLNFIVMTADPNEEYIPAPAVDMNLKW